jgi:hypothetical protein
MQVLRRLWLGLLSYKFVYIYTVLLLVIGFTSYTQAASRQYIRFDDRSLLIYNSEPGVTTTYKVSLTYHTPANISALDMQFCKDPIPYDPCDPPAGLDVSHAVLSDQTGVNDYAITGQNDHQITLTRDPSTPVGQTPSTYTFTGIVNATDMSHSYAIRLADFTDANDVGTQNFVDVGAVTTQVQEGVTLETQVPPILVFCVEKIVNNTCNINSGGNYQDLGDINDDDLKTLVTTSQMGAGTNASNGYSITVHGTTVASGTHIIDPLTAPTESAPGNSQFGINLVKNTAPNVGENLDDSTGNVAISPGYDVPNKFMYHDGDEVASASSVSLVGRYTVSYILNTPPKLRAGVYTTTITYICTGRF